MTWKTQIDWLKEDGKRHGTLPKNKIWRESRHAKLTRIYKMVLLVLIDVQEIILSKRMLHGNDCMRSMQKKMTENGYRVISLTRWVQYVHFFPWIKTVKISGGCLMPVLLLIWSWCPLNWLKKESMHLDAARYQRCMINEFVQLFVHQHIPGQPILSPLPEEIKEDHPLVAHDPNKLTVIIFPKLQCMHKLLEAVWLWL